MSWNILLQERQCYVCNRTKNTLNLSSRLTPRHATHAACRSKREMGTGPRCSLVACHPTSPRRTFVTSSHALGAWWRWSLCSIRKRRNQEVSWRPLFMLRFCFPYFILFSQLYILWSLIIIFIAGILVLRTLAKTLPKDMFCMLVLTCSAAGSHPFQHLETGSLVPQTPYSQQSVQERVQ